MLRPKTIRTMLLVSHHIKNDDTRSTLVCMQIPAQNNLPFHILTCVSPFWIIRIYLCSKMVTMNGKIVSKKFTSINTCALSFQTRIKKKERQKFYVKTYTHHRQYSFYVFCLICSLENRFPWSIHLVKRRSMLCYK